VFLVFSAVFTVLDGFRCSVCRFRETNACESNSFGRTVRVMDFQCMRYRVCEWQSTVCHNSEVHCSMGTLEFLILQLDVQHAFQECVLA
jgi:hypothetical protein